MLIAILLAVLPMPWGPLAERLPLPTGPLAENPLPGPSHDATATATDGQLKQRRIADYARCHREAERTGKAIYRSDGKPGSALPAGLYELIRQDDDVKYREIQPAGVPIPKPDAATIRNFRIVGDDCIGTA